MTGLIKGSKPEIVEYELKLKRAMDLRIGGWLPSEIAEELGYDSGEQVRGMIERRIKSDALSSAEEARNQDLVRLDAMLRALWTRCMDGDNRSMQTALHIMEMRMKLMGLERAPEGEKRDVGGVTVIVNRVDANEIKPMQGVVIDVDAIERNAETVGN